MKLLFDQNLSRHLVDAIAAIWPDSTHVTSLAMETASDFELWQYAKKHGYTLISKDTDFLHMSLLYGAPPKIIIIRTGNVSTSDVRHCLLAYQSDIMAFTANMSESVLVIP